MAEGFFIWGALLGYIWGQWLAERQAKRKVDPAMTLLLSMLADVQQKRRLVGRGLTITRFEHLDLKGEQYTLSLASKGDPEAIEREAA